MDIHITSYIPMYLTWTPGSLIRGIAKGSKEGIYLHHSPLPSYQNYIESYVLSHAITSIPDNSFNLLYVDSHR